MTYTEFYIELSEIIENYRCGMVKPEAQYRLESLVERSRHLYINIYIDELLNTIEESLDNSSYSSYC